MTDFRVSIPVSSAADILEEAVKKSGVSVKLVDRYDVSGAGAGAVTMVFEKYFMRNSSRASLTVTVSDLKGATFVHAVGSGGGQDALFKFDWGASEAFERSVKDALNDYISI